MRCSECGQTNVAGSLFCERCGSDLAATTELPPVASPAAAATGATPPLVECPACGCGNPPEYLVCESCGAALSETDEPPPAPRPVEPARRVELPGVPPPPPELPVQPSERPAAAAIGPRKGKVKLVVEQGMVVGKQFLLNNDTMLVGREDATDEIYPDIDLTGLDEGYVHRRHASLAFEGSFLFVTHLGGHNRTYVNNRPIADHLAYPLNVGDTVRFGKVLMRLVEAT